VWQPTPEELEKKPARLRQLYHVCHTQIIGTKVSRILDGMAGSSIPGRSVILSSHGDNQSLAASWGSHIRQSHPYVGSLLGASKVSRVLGGMAGSSILGRPWLCLRMETINVDGGGAASSDIHIHMLSSSLNLHQAPGENIAGHLASNSAGHVNKQALPYCPAPLEHSMNLDSTARKLRMERTAQRLQRAKRSLRRRPRQCLRERTILFGR